MQFRSVLVSLCCVFTCWTTSGIALAETAKNMSEYRKARLLDLCLAISRPASSCIRFTDEDFSRLVKNHAATFDEICRNSRSKPFCPNKEYYAPMECSDEEALDSLDSFACYAKHAASAAFRSSTNNLGHITEKNADLIDQIQFPFYPDTIRVSTLVPESIGKPEKSDDTSSYLMSENYGSRLVIGKSYLDPRLASKPLTAEFRRFGESDQTRGDPEPEDEPLGKSVFSLSGFVAFYPNGIDAEERLPAPFLFVEADIQSNKDSGKIVHGIGFDGVLPFNNENGLFRNFIKYKVSANYQTDRKYDAEIYSVEGKADLFWEAIAASPSLRPVFGQSDNLTWTWFPSAILDWNQIDDTGVLTGVTTGSQTNGALQAELLFRAYRRFKLSQSVIGWKEFENNKSEHLFFSTTAAYQPFENTPLELTISYDRGETGIEFKKKDQLTYGIGFRWPPE